MPGYINRQVIPKEKRLAPRRDAYARPDSRVEYQIFSSEYFSNADVKLYFGDIWIDDATSIAIQLQEDLMPIYGYNSYTFDAIARGKRLVQGQFSINFTTVGYLHEIVANAHAIFYALEQGEKNGIIKPEYYQNLKLGEIMQRLGKESFDQVADEYEKAIWGANDDKEEQLSYADRPYFRQDQLGFDIRIQYGAVTEATGYVQGKFYQSVKEESPNMTVDVINGVQLSGMSKQIATSDQGAPIQESYSFIARDLNGVSFAQLSRNLSASKSSSKEPIDTTYRKMQYGVIR
ncbi:hypothetical protein C2I27_04075 [Priestia megaterium]|uniref:hypothetical protein n=1 Tax=Priestia megaterium TaxID=1404 RepID=UPI000D51F495|nr:hypothetical protein [Priestia megaterium]PVC75071.1 hypothetical protein C2I27_04075 [Priestia megaterium]